ncbi:MAG: CotH kinase family protein [Saprospiraceae bacterium]|nr:CotH kinase family protein [Saprospiraceae bacterium]
MRSGFRLSLFLLCFLAGQTGFAQVVINEFSAANMTTIPDISGEYEDWIELYNPGPGAANLSGYHLSDRVNNPTKWVIPNGVSIPAGGFMVFFASDRNGLVAGQYHTNFKITQTDPKEAVVLADPAGTILDVHDLDIPNQQNHSWCRFPNGGPWNLGTTPTPGASNNSTYTTYAPTPAADLEAGYYPGAISVALTSTLPGTIRYTTDGSTPGAGSPVYAGPISVSSTRILRWYLIPSDPTIHPSNRETNSYFIGPDKHDIKVISICGNNLPTLLTGSSITPQGTFELFSETGTFIDEASGEYNKHGNDSWAYAQRGIDYITRDQMGVDDEIHFPLFPLQNRKDFQRLILKAAANDNYPFVNGAHIRDAYVHELAQRAQMNLDVRSYEPCILYVNGNYWGVYEIREKVDDKDYIKRYYNLEENQVDFIKTWGGTWAEYGTTANWNTLRSYILANDMTNPANFQYVADRLDMLSLADYFIINIHTVCKDWLNWNTAWWGGDDGQGNLVKWRYTLWDMDATFGHYINYTNVPNTGPTADPCDIESLPNNSDPQSHIDVLMKLFDNPEFHDLYINRYADLNNTALSCSAMINVLDELIARIEPEMPRQITRWGGTMAAWQAEVQELRDFILSRCVEIEDGLTDCYQLSGPHELTVIVMPQGSPNNVRINTLNPTQYPFRGKYYGGTDLDLTALPDPDWTFVRWETDSFDLGPDLMANPVDGKLNGPDTLWAYFEPICMLGVEILPPNKVALDCYQAPVVLEGVAFDGSDQYTWTWTDENGTIVQSGSNTSYTVQAPGWYTMAVWDEQFQCERTDSFEVIDNRVYPVPDLVDPTLLTCINTTATLDATASGNGLNFSWSGPCTTGDPTQGMINGTCPGWYSVILTDPANGCTSIDSVEIKQDIQPPQNIALATSRDTLPCLGTGVVASLQGPGLSQGYTYSWTSTGQISGDPLSAQITALTPGWFLVQVTDPLNGCFFNDSLLVVPALDLQLTMDFTLVQPSCDQADDGRVLIDNIQGGTAPYTIEHLNTGAIAVNGLLSGLSAGSQPIRITDQAGCAADTLVDLIPLPPADFSIVSAPAGCVTALNGSLTIQNIQGGVGPFSYEIQPGGTSADPLFDGLAAGSYTLTLHYAGVCSVSKDADVGILPPVPLDAALISPTCATGTNGQITLLPGGGEPPYTWFLDGQLGTGPVFTGLNPGTYQLSVEDAFGCISTSQVTLDLGLPPTIDLGADLFVLLGDWVDIHPSISGTAASLSWPGFTCPNCPSLSFQAWMDTTVSVLMVDDGGCTASDELNVHVKAREEIYWPGAFSPNGDGINDLWLPVALSPQAQLLEAGIYDRWGNLVYSRSNTPLNDATAWDGTMNGDPCQNGVYVYHCRIQIEPGKVVERAGEILLVR